MQRLVLYSYVMILYVAICSQFLCLLVDPYKLIDSMRPLISQEPKLAFEDVDATELYPCVMFYSSNPGEKVKQHKWPAVCDALLAELLDKTLCTASAI